MVQICRCKSAPFRLPSPEWGTQKSASSLLNPTLLTLKPPQTPLTAQGSAPKKVSSKATKAQKRAQQLEFNRQLWAEA